MAGTCPTARRTLLCTLGVPPHRVLQSVFNISGGKRRGRRGIRAERDELEVDIMHAEFTAWNLSRSAVGLGPNMVGELEDFHPQLRTAMPQVCLSNSSEVVEHDLPPIAGLQMLNPRPTPIGLALQAVSVGNNEAVNHDLV